MEGYVYFLKSEESDLIKIGRTSKKMYLRRKEIQNMSPVQLYSIGILKVPDCIQFEKELHELFADLRCWGEWFDFGSRTGTLKRCFRGSGTFDYSSFKEFWKGELYNPKSDPLAHRKPNYNLNRKKPVFAIARMKRERKLAYG